MEHSVSHAIKPDLNEFISEWEQKYRSEIDQVAVFDPEQTSNWSMEKKRYFAKIFYHIRGHFHDFLWFMGSHAPDAHTKQIVLNNIAEEFSMNGISHEKLYHLFAQTLDTNMSDEIVDEHFYLPFVKKFNKNHMSWLTSHGWIECFSAFSAYEKLDNVDYFYLHRLAKSFDVNGRALTFFSIHLYVEHFDVTFQNLLDMWKKDAAGVEKAFIFISSNQLEMWKGLANAMGNYQG
ncbi:MAG: hypothetical protein A3F10_04480 [Coxiella sp. RIFCSPHIGHO2_12_FULL_42_15]|nr:MAG: hypothetical protein A3F10_04480 [Coxiella sp. RIFCSPHIGHO2_12_FULL_42_15]